MKSICIKITTENDAFGDFDQENAAEVNRILQTVIEKLDCECFEGFPLMDINGNKVGNVSIQD